MCHVIIPKETQSALYSLHLLVTCNMLILHEYLIKFSGILEMKLPKTFAILLNDLFCTFQ